MLVSLHTVLTVVVLCDNISAVPGPHTMLMTPDARISGAGFERWGARNVAGECLEGGPPRMLHTYSKRFK